MRNLQTVQVRTGSSFEKICPFPVGYIYMSSNSTSPANIYGGTWSALTDSRFLRPAGNWGGTGGSTTHTLTINEMPSHSHSLGDFWHCGGGNAIFAYGSYYIAEHQIYNSQYVGGSQPFSIQNPFRNCYAWYRTA